MNKLKLEISSIIFMLIVSACAREDIEGNVWVQGFRVQDESGSAVAGANVFVVSPDYRNKDKPSGVSDEKGQVTLTGQKSMLLKCVVKKENYYTTSGKELNFFWKPYKNQDGKTVFELKPKQKIFPVTLKKKIKPIAMHAKWVRYFQVPVKGKDVGYDLKVGDWVAPYGLGKISDFIFHYTADVFSKNEYSSKLIIKFSNEKDGLIPYTHDFRKGGSELRSNHQAPKEGYQATWEQIEIRKLGAPHVQSLDYNRNYYFRVRTKLNDEGHIIDAHYGKIYGDFINFKHYFNPSRNDRNVEFDPSRNLNTDLKSWEEKVASP